MGSPTIAPTAKGVTVRVDGVALTSTPDYPDGFRWTQTITTNVRRGGPLLPAPVSFVDPDPHDDNKPFYWTDAEEARSVGVFTDAPSVDGHDETRFDSMAYGFTVDSGGAVTTRGPGSPADVADHQATLQSSFPGWSFG